MGNARTGPGHIVIAVDGTKQHGHGGRDVEGNTNVYRANLCIQDSRLTGVDVSYIPGIGVEGWVGRRVVERALGSGIDKQICEAYKSLCKAHQFPEDKIILTGYSRGAFTIRCLVDIVSKFGILEDVQSDQWPKMVFEIWKSRKDDVPAYLRRVKIEPSNIVCVLWDTVGSVEKGLLQLIDSETEGGGSNYHALALHERRKDYLPTVMRFKEGVDLTESEQCWFLGYHGDVGGGRKKNALGNVALAWALGKVSRDLPVPVNWEPLGETDNAPGDNWKLNRGNLAFDVKDTFKGWIRARYFRNRYPKREFWAGPLHKTLSLSDNVYECLTQETIHKTVRDLKPYINRSTEALHNADLPERPPAPVRGWRLYEKKWEVNEAALSTVERGGLYWWVIKNLAELQELSELGQKPPDTVIDELLDILR